TACVGTLKDALPFPLLCASDRDILILENDFGKDVLEKVALRLGRSLRSGGQSTANSERRCHRLHHAIDGIADVGGAAEIEAAQERSVAVDILREERLDELVQVGAQARDLRRELKDSLPVLEPSRFSELRKRALLDDRGQLVKLREEGVADRGKLRAHGLGGAPDLPALSFGKIAKNLHKAGQQVALGEHCVDGHDNLEPLHCLVDALSERLAEG